MLSIRIVAAGALVSIMTVGASAQTTTSTETGKPIQLLRVLTQPDKAKTKLYAKRALKIRTATNRTDKRHSLVARERPIHVAEAAKASGPSTAPTSVWTDPTPSPAPADLVTAEPSSQPPAALESNPNELVVGGQTVHVVAADDANEIDRAADAQAVPPAAGTQSVIAATDPAPDTATIARAHEETSQVGSASWIAQVLAALGGAVAAGTAAWFLMGSTPQRTYG